MMHPPNETREQRETITEKALADAVRRRMTLRRSRQTDVARWSGVSRSCVQHVLRGNKNISLFVFMELSSGLGYDDPCDLLRDILNRRDALRTSAAERASEPRVNHAPTA